jgi:hypothetical protein
MAAGGDARATVARASPPGAKLGHAISRALPGTPAEVRMSETRIEPPANASR